ncbi:MAG TPA: hypothetical protein PK095_21730, partial [Myxococcota bacterium]|nr:hypothetical protein [Myxococcota bacterium]
AQDGTGRLPVVGGVGHELRATATVIGPRALSATFDWPPIDPGLPNRIAPIQGELSVVRYLDNQDITSPPLLFSGTLANTLTPTLNAVSPATLYLGDTLIAEGHDALLPSEGLTLFRFTGQLSDGETVTPITDLTVPGYTLGQLDDTFTPAPFGDLATRLDRRKVGLELSPDLFGIRARSFEGTVTLVNAHLAALGATSGPELASTPLPIALTLPPPIVTGVTPTRPSRGMWLTATGRGFVHSDGLLQTATLLELEGVFTPSRGATTEYLGPNRLYIFPEDLDPTAFTTVLRPNRSDHDDGLPLGATPGRFVGRVTPVVLAGPDRVVGDGLDLDLEIGGPHQVVQIVFLPGFDEALARFGLHAEKDAVIARILEVAARDYAGIHLSFVLEEPAAFSEYTLIEVGGPDPNGTGLFGLDNTAGKDVGNLRFDDVIGGFNAETQSGNLAAYGGVFASELMNLSPTLSDNPLASPRFDDVFGDLAPELGGEPAERNERFGPRGPTILEAVRVLGNLIGSTVTHEVGHALGLTALDGRYHNDGDTPLALMDAGVFRPFLERAELDGMPPAALEPYNRLYLESILPPVGPGGPASP